MGDTTITTLNERPKELDIYLAGKINGLRILMPDGISSIKLEYKDYDGNWRPLNSVQKLKLELPKVTIERYIR